MDRRSSGFLVINAVLFALALAGCVGKSSNNPGNLAIQSVSLTPATTLSLDLAATQTFTATAQNSLGQAVLTTIHFASSNNASLTIANNGLACAGSWDSLVVPVVCTPGVAGVAVVTATAGGVSSPPTTVYVHQHIDSIAVNPVGTPATDCFSLGDPNPQKRTWMYQATAFSNGADITNSVGPINWTAVPANVLTTVTAGLQSNQVQATAKDPGITRLFASASGVTSSPLSYTTCLVSYIRLQIQSGSGNSVTLAAGGAKTIVATAVDTLNNIVSKPPLTWITSNPEVATVTNGAVSAKQNASAAVISASCTPPTCNIGVLPGLPIYASTGPIPNLETPGFGVITVNVTNAKPPAFTAWTATTGCGTAFNCTSAMFSVTAGNTPIASTVGLSRTPNSMQFIPAGTRVYLGSDQGLMFVDVGTSSTVGTVSSASSPCNLILCGKVLAISQDGNRVAVSDTVTHDQVYIYDNAHPTSAAVDLLIPNATAAAFSPDGMKLFILSASGKLFVDSTLDAVTSVPISASATDVAFSADGSFVYVAGDPGASISGYSTCSLPGIPTSNIGNGPTSAPPVRIFPSPAVQADGPALITVDNEPPTDPPNPNLNMPSLVQNLVALEPPNIEILKAQFTQNPTTDPTKLTCNPPVAETPSVPFISKISSFDLGQGDFTPVYMQVVGSSQAIVLAQNVPAVLVFDIAGGTTTPIPLVNNGVPLAASSSPDGSQVFVAACEEFQDNDVTKPCLVGSVHIVNPRNGGDIQQVPFVNRNTNDSMCSNLDLSQPPCLPNLIAVKPL